MRTDAEPNVFDKVFLELWLLLLDERQRMLVKISDYDAVLHLAEEICLKRKKKVVVVLLFLCKSSVHSGRDDKSRRTLSASMMNVRPVFEL